jgi:FkbM family methyltransferase
VPDGADGRIDELFGALRLAEQHAPDPRDYRERIRWPLIRSVLALTKTRRVRLSTGLVFEVGADSQIERELFLSAEERPDHVWEPQTTKLLVRLARGCTHVIVGGAYIGDHVLPIAWANPGTTVHAFEPMQQPFERLRRNVELNRIENVRLSQLALWDRSGERLRLEGAPALASTVVSADGEVVSLSIDDCAARLGVPGVGLIMLDLEGGEEKALRGARRLLAEPKGSAPALVFEVHRNFVDWSGGLETTSILRLVASVGYSVFAVRDFHANHSTEALPIEIVPVDAVYLEGPPHGFNLFATKDLPQIDELGLRIVRDVSPKLLLDRDPALHLPLHESEASPTLLQSGG